MRLIEDLSAQEINQIVTCLEQDGFTNIKVNARTIDFSLPPVEQGVARNFSLLSTNVYSKDDLGLRIDFDYQEFLKKNYELKSRHSISLGEAIEKNGSVEDACTKLGWKITKSKACSTSPEWTADLYSLTIYEVQIGALSHIIVEQEDESQYEVYGGELGRLWAMGSQKIEDLLTDKAILNLLRDLDRS